MKNCLLLIAALFILTFQMIPVSVNGQNYDLIDYSINGTPTNGVKIKTNIPFESGSSMPTVRIEGYNYSKAQPIGLSVVWYVFNGKFIHAVVSSWGAYTPPIYLANENGLIALFIDDRSYFQRFHVSAYAKGMSDEDSSSFSGWTAVDEPLNGTDQVLVPYKNSLAGKVTIDGKLLIDKTSQTNPSYKLDVNGNIRANKVVVNTSGADYVFDSTYHLMSLDSLEKYVQTYHHLPGIPSAKEMQREGLSIGDAYSKLLEKMEEMTRYMIERGEMVEKQNLKIDSLSSLLDKISKDK